MGCSLLRLSFWIGLAYVCGSTHLVIAQQEKKTDDRAVYVVARVPGKVITNVDLASFYHQVAPMGKSKEEALIELIMRYLMIWHAQGILDVRKTKSLEIKEAVYQELSYYRKIGYSDAQIEYIRKQVTNEVVDRITFQEFLRQKVALVSHVSPAEVHAFYKKKCLGKDFQIPKKYRIVRFYYILEKKEVNEGLQWDIAFFSALCEAVTQMKGELSLHTLAEWVTQHYWQKGKKLVMHPLFSALGDPYLTSDDFDLKWESLFELPDADWYGGLFSKPYRRDTYDGKKVVEILYLLEVIPAHSMNLAQDYPTIQNWLLREKQDHAITAWLKAHAHEVVIEDSRYIKVIENL